ncbi:MAG: molecular chaperone HscC [Pseudomonadota bacterium]
MADDEKIVGIDLGTTNSLVAVFEPGGPRLIPNKHGELLTPSVVGYDDKGAVMVGQAAKYRLTTHPEKTAARFKRHMGTNRGISLGKKMFRAEELSALVLRSLKDDAEADLGEPINHAVISVPAYFNDVQRKATQAAAELAGLNVARLINEPTAAALAYGVEDRTAEHRFLVLDLGGGTFDVSILEMFSGVMEVRASSGDAFLGGEDFTDALAAHFAAQLGVKAGDMEAEDRARLRRLADSIKHRLSGVAEAKAEFAYKKKTHTLVCSRGTFDEITGPILKRLRLPIQRAVSDAGLRSDAFDRIIAVGGATRMPAVRALATRMFDRFPEFSIDPDHVVAMGAAVQAGLAQRHEALEDVVMTDVAPFTLGFETGVQVGEHQFERGHFSPLIERNTVIPVSRADTVHPLERGQTAIVIRVYQGESPFVRDNALLGSLNVPIPYNKKEHEAVDVRYTYDNSGLLEVVAKVVSNDKTFRLVIEGNPGAMTASEIAERLKALSKLKIHPRDKQENTAFIARLTAAYENCLGDERTRIQGLIAEFQKALSTQDERHVAEVRAAIEPILSRLENFDVL